MKTNIASSITIALFLGAFTSKAAVQVFTDERSFVNALSGTQSTLNFNTATVGPISNNQFVAQGFTFTSPLSSPFGKIEVAPSAWFWSSPYLSIDQRPWTTTPDQNDDSLNISVNGNWCAAGFGIVDGAVPGQGESVTFYGDDDTVLYQRLPANGAVSFLGVIADQPIRRIAVKEAANDGDDIGYDNFHLGKLAAPAPTIQVSQVRICWDTFTNTTYQLQYRSDLTTNTWVNLGTPVQGTGSRTCMTDDVVSPCRFYQVVILP